MCIRDRQYWPPFWIPGVHRMDLPEITRYSIHYRDLLTALAEDAITEADIQRVQLMNDVVPKPTELTHGK